MEFQVQKPSTSFDDLPYEVKILIFQYLSVDERKEAAFVCKAWQRLLQDSTFNTDFQIKLFDCFLMDNIPPLSIFKNAQRTYTRLYIGDNISSFTPSGTAEFMTFLGQNIRHLELDRRFASILSGTALCKFFPNLQKITLEFVSHLQKFSEFPDSLTHVHSRIFKIIEAEDLEQLKKIKNIKLLTSDSINLEEAYMSTCMIHKVVSDIEQRLAKKEDNLMERVRSMNMLMNLHAERNGKLEDKTEIRIENVLIPRAIHLVLKDVALNTFKSLKSIFIAWNPNRTLELAGNRCFFGHDVILCPKLESLKIDWLKFRDCAECFTTMINSFPNLKSLALYHNEFKDEQVMEVCRSLSQLEVLEIESNRITDAIFVGDNEKSLIGNLKQLRTLNISESYKITDESFKAWPPMPFLEKLSLGTISAVIQPESMRNFVDACPNIRFFSIGVDSSLTDNDLEMMVQKWHNLETLHLYIYGTFTDRGWNAIKQHCKNLKYLYILEPTLNISVEYSFFHEIPSLRRLENDERPMLRKDFHFIQKYLKRHGIPFEDIGDLQNVTSEYSLEDLDDEEEDDE